MADVLSPVDTLDMEQIEGDPEAIFDFITIRALQERYGTTEPHRAKPNNYLPSPKADAIYVNEIDFETFVQQFPIDDSIAECFASSSDTAPKPETKFVSGGKRPQLSTKYSKLKKKFGRKPSDDVSLLSDEELRSREIKRSKKAGGVFSKRHKWRNLPIAGSKKSVNFSDHSEKSESDIVDDVFDAAEESSATCQKPEVTHWGSFSASDSQITSFSETLARLRGENSTTNSTETSLIKTGSQSSVRRAKSLDPKTRTKGQTASATASVTEVVETPDEMTNILSGSTSDIISKLEDSPSDKISGIRDENENTLLHRGVILGNPDLVKYTMERFPEMTSDLNSENETAIELAAKTGRYECLKVMIERTQRRHSPGSSMMNRLLNICAQNGQPECMGLLLTNMSRVPHASCTLPGDARGNTAAHLSAKHGHLQCLHTLVSSGFNVMSENLLQQRPLQVAHQSRSHLCFEYLLLLDVCRELFSSLKSQFRLNARLSDQLSGGKSCLDYVRNCVRRYGELCRETSQSLEDCRTSIMQTLRNIHSDLELCVEGCDAEKTERLGTREKIKELSAEIERLEDTFDFSPFAEMDSVMAKLSASLDEIVANTKDEDMEHDRLESVEEDAERILGSLIKDVHREYMLENWNTQDIYKKHVSTGTGTNSNSPPTFKPNETFIDGKAFVSQSLIGQPCEPMNGEVSYFENLPNEKSTKLKRDAASENNGERSDSNLMNGDTHGSSGYSDVTVNDNGNASETNIDTKGNESDKENIESENPTERPFTKLLSLDERIDLLIAGERRKEEEEDLKIDNIPIERRDSYQQPPSLYTSTFTSITSDASCSSDWCNRLCLGSLEDSNSADDVTKNDVSFDVTASDTASYWWDAGDKELESRDFKLSVPYSKEVRRRIHLNLENDGSTVHELRNQRLANHIKSVQQTRLPSENYRERITTSTGEVIGGFQSSKELSNRRVLVDVNGALRNRKQPKPVPKPRKRGKAKLFTLEDAIATGQREETDTESRDSILRMRWEDMSLTDEDHSLSWSDYSRREPLSTMSEAGDSDSSINPHSFV